MERGAAGAFWIGLTFAEFRVVYHQNRYPLPNVIIIIALINAVKDSSTH